MNRVLLGLTAALTLLAIGCVSMPRCPEGVQDLSAYALAETNQRVWFKNALVYTSYHEATIAPAEVLHYDRYFADHLETSEKPCMARRRLEKMLARSRFMRITGRGRYRDDPRRFVIDCVCSAEAVEPSVELQEAMRPLIPSH